MNDPAVEAAQRYRDRGYPESDGLIGAAREALKPIQKWHRRLADAYSLDERPEGALIRAALDELVQLIYPEDEW